MHIDHWVYDLLDQMAASGVAAEWWLPGRRPASGAVILAVLEMVADSSGGTWSATAAEAKDWILAEHGLEQENALRIDPLLELELKEQPDVQRRAAGAGAAGVWSPRSDVALFGDLIFEYAGSGVGVELPRAGLAWRHRALLFTASRDRRRWGRGAEGGVILGGEGLLTGLSVAISEPTRLGGWLDWLGPVEASFGINGIGGNEYGPAAAFFTAETRLRPHSRLLLSLQRTVVVVDEFEGRRISARDVLYEVFGKHTPFGDTHLALAASGRITMAGLETVPYIEWGIEDSSGMQDDPAVILGLQLPHVDVADVPVGVRYEYVGIGESGRVLWRRWGHFEQRQWYMHQYVRPRYVNERNELLGHPLGGYGYQHLVDVAVPLLRHGLAARGGLVIKKREISQLPPETRYPGINLLYDVFPGRSHGAFVELSVQRTRGDLRIGVSAEKGEVGWRRWSGRIRSVWRW